VTCFEPDAGDRDDEEWTDLPDLGDEPDQRSW
jgi:hypothetical protein